MVQVGCVGLLVEDTFCGPLPALPPEGALAHLASMPVHAGGCAANVALDLARQGISVDVVGCVGADPAGSLIRNSLAAAGVGVGRMLELADTSTSKTVVLLIEGQDRRYFHLSGANDRLQVDLIDRGWLADLKIFYLGGLFGLRGLDLRALQRLLRDCRANGVTTVVDVLAPHDDAEIAQLAQVLPLIDAFLPNEDEALALTGLTAPMDQLASLRAAGANTVIITRGRHGAIAALDDQVWTCGAYALDVVDPSGSGDAFASGVIRGLLEGWDVPQILHYASAVGASATRAAGTTESVFTAEEAEAFLANHPLRVRNEH